MGLVLALIMTMRTASFLAGGLAQLRVLQLIAVRS